MRGTRLVLLALVTALAASLLTANAAAAAPLERVLVFSKTAGFRHDSIPTGIAAIQQIGAANGFQVDATEDATAFSDMNLAQYDAVIWLSTTGDVLTPLQQDAFQRYIRAGNGYVGIHAASDTEYTWDWYGDLVGAYFASHPPATPTAAIDVEDGAHASTSTLPTRWTRTDEWYNYKPPAAGAAPGGDYSPRYDVHVLATLDESTYDEQDGSAEADDHPIAWCSNFDGGYSWYTGGGHTSESYAEPEFRAHILGGIRSVTDLAGAGCGETRVPSPSAADFEKVTLDDDTSNPFELDIAPDGRVFYIERDGRVMLWKPTTETTVQIGSVPVTQSQENGLLGIQLAPDFTTSGHIYLAYSALPDSSGQNRLSRFTVAGDQIQAGSEQIIYTWQHQRQQCCHTSGSLAFGPGGMLYISTGDNTNPFASDGFTPIDERAGRQPWDAQRTSANSNDPNGKILRIMPLAGATGTPGIGTTYAIPPGNMFDEAQDTQNQTLPEIYAMGFRNPFRITVDPKTGWLLLGDYGPDAGSTVANRGPQGSVEFNVVDQPGFYGWPYCVRDNVAYNDYDFATGVSGPKFDCANPVNASPNNTGLTNLPPAQPATTWHGYTERDPRFPYLGTGGAPTGGPRYDFDPANPSTTKFPEYYDGKWFIGEWNNGWIKTATLNDDGSARGVGPFDLETGYLRPMDIEFGPDGSLYVIEWGSGFGGNNLDSGIYRIDYVGAGRRPIAQATATPDSGPAPLTVEFSSAGSNDPDGTSLSYAWDFDGDGDVDSSEPNATFEYTTAGNYTATLRVTDESGATGVDNVAITVGNSRPQVTIEIPENGQVAAFGDVIPYRITVTDAEDGSTSPGGGIDCADVTLNISLGHDEHAHELDEKTGCEGTFETLSASGHGDEANVFPVIEAVYTDRGSGQAGALTGRDEVILQPDPKQAEFFDSTGRVPGAPAGGDPGVQTETTSDPEGGGLNIGFIEDGDYVSYEPFNLEGIRGLSFRVASGGSGGTIQLRLDAPDGPLVAETAFIAPTGGWQNWTDVALALPNPPEGTHELFVVFRGGAGGLMNLNFIEFAGKGAAISEAPEVSAAAGPATGTAPLTVNFDGEATDADAQPGDTLTYHWDFGVSGTTTDTSTELDPTFTYERAGTYTATFTATDPTGQKGTDSVEVRVTPSDQCPTGPLRSDEFDGNSLDTNRWTVQRSNDNFEVANGQLRLPIDNGSMYAGGMTARNVIVQDTPEGAWEVTAKVTAEQLTQNFHQAGLRVWSDDDNWASVHMIHAGGQRDFEFIYEANGMPRNEGLDKLGGIPADSPTTYYVRIVSDGQQLTAFYSFDGDTFLPVGRPAPLSTFANPQIGPAALSDAAPSTPDAFFDWIRFEPDGTGGGGGGTVDEFDGSALARPPWDVVRENQNLTVSGGALRIPAAQGDIYGGGGNAPNLVLRDAPDGAWQAITKLSFEGTAQYHQAGLLVYGDDDNYTKFGRIAHTAAGDEKFEYIYETAGSPRNDAADSTANLAAGFPDDFFLRITSDGTNITGAYSTDGATWTPVGRPAPLPANARVGMFAFNNQATTTPEAAFDSFRLTGPGGGGGPPAGPSRDDQFDGSSLDTTRWNAIVRDNPSAYSVSGGELTITTEPGDIYTGDTTPPPNNFILQSADHAGADWTIETKLSGTIDGGYGQGGLMAYVDDANYVKFDAISDAGNTRINRIELRSEVGGAIAAPEPNADVPVGTTDIWLRLAKTGTSYAGSYSFDGQTWTAMPAAVTNGIASPRFGVYAFGPQPEGQGDTVSFDYFTLDGLDQGCECVARGDAFDGASLDKTRWNEIVREDDTNYVVENGGLEVTTVGGDIFAGSDPSGTRNFFLQSADHAGADYVLETKLSGTIDGGFAQGGLLVYTDDGDYVKFDAISDDGNTRINRIELRSEVGDTVQNPQPQADVPMGTTDIWLRLTKEGTSYSGEYSFDGTSWTALAQPVTNPQEAPRFGLFTLGVNKPGGTITFDHFKVDGQLGCEEPPPTNTPPVIASATASPTSGFVPLQVDFAVTATDADGDDLSYSWDFDGDGTEDSTAEDPSHTYTAAGVYDAEVTVSDGEAERTRTVTVTVLAPDDPSARFRVLVFSETTGFRHDSIDEGIAAIRALGRANEFQVDATEDSTVFRDSVLAHYDTVVFLNTTGDPLNNIQQAAFQRYIRAGGGYTGVHSAADTEYDWNWYGHLVGAYFLSHPPGTPTATTDVEDLTNRSTEHLPARWERTDEWYNYRSPDFADPDVPDGDYSPREGGVHVLASVDESTYEELDGNDPVVDDHPIAWCQPYDGGRSWYTGMGHTAASFSEPDYLEHLLGGIEITAGAASSPECTNERPTVQVAADPQTGNAPLTVSFTSAGSDPEGQNLVYSWDFDDGGRAFGQNATHTYQQAGTYMAKVTVTDPDGATGTAEIEIIVTDPPNRAPTVRAAADPGSGDAPLDVRFSAEGTDPDGDSLVYEWDFGDGGRAFGAQATHRYATAGEYDATVTVTDPDGATGTATVHVTVSGNHAPSVTMTANPQSGTAPLRVRFEAQGSDPDGGSLRYRWNFGDGSSPETDRRETHTYRNPGTYTARVTATDREGASSSAELQITVTERRVNQPPSVTMTATPQTGAAPLQVLLSALGSDPEGGPLSYRWSFGGDDDDDDGDSRSGSEVTYEFRRRGTHTARVTVTDAEGARRSAELRITVTRSGGS